jgi:DNA-binding CsgD family transcriptional regulator
VVPDPVLTARERQIAKLAAAGVPSKEIAEQLFLSARTVDNHLLRVYNKLGVSGRNELAAALRTLPAEC